MIIKDKFIETRRAFAPLNGVSHISWTHHQDGEYDVKLHLGNDRIIQRMNKDELDELILEFKSVDKNNINPNRPILQDSIGTLYVENGFLEHSRKWSVDLTEVEFISYKQNEENFTYFVKLHIMAKEVRIYLDTLEEVEQLIQIWKQYR